MSRPDARAGALAALNAVHIFPQAIRSRHATHAPMTTSQCERQYGIACYNPFQIQRAYNLPVLYRHGRAGQGATIALIDAFGSPTMRKDLATFDRQFHLPSAPLRIIQPAGKVPAYRPSDNRIGWAFETELDVEYAHVIAPRAKLLLVETPTSENEGESGFPDIVKAETYVARHHLADVMSQSFGATEQTFPSPRALRALRGANFAAARNHVTMLAASGDAGAGDTKYDGTTMYPFPVTSWPTSDPLVTAVAGTELHLGARGYRRSPDTVWNDSRNRTTNEFVFGDAGPNALASGSGRSVVFSRPGYQDRYRSLVGNHRGVADVAMSGSCSAQVNVYIGFPGLPSGYYPVCGTSESSPLFAGIVAIAAQVANRPLGLINPAMYRMGAQRQPGVVDVTRGDTTVSFPQGGRQLTVHGDAARRGYDLASGVGTVDASRFVYELARATRR